VLGKMHGALNIVGVEARTDETEARGDTLEQKRALFHRELGGGGHDDFELLVGERDHWSIGVDIGMPSRSGGIASR
jgi:hypothetical protein